MDLGPETYALLTVVARNTGMPLLFAKKLSGDAGFVSAASSAVNRAATDEPSVESATKKDAMTDPCRVAVSRMVCEGTAHSWINFWYKLSQSYLAKSRLKCHS